SKQKIPKACETLRIAPVPSPSPFPQPSRERRSFARVGLLANGVFCLLPAPSRPPHVDSGFCGFRPHFTAAGPRGIYTLFPSPGDICCATSLYGSPRSLVKFKFVHSRHRQRSPRTPLTL